MIADSDSVNGDRGSDKNNDSDVVVDDDDDDDDDDDSADDDAYCVCVIY